MKKLVVFLLFLFSFSLVTISCTSGEEKNSVETGSVKNNDSNHDKPSNEESGVDKTDNGKTGKPNSKDNKTENQEKGASVTTKNNNSNQEESNSNDGTNNDSQKTNSEENQSSLNSDEVYEIKLTSSDVKTTTFNMTASKTYTLVLLGEWSGNDMAILASKLKKGVSTECNIILDDSKGVITAGMDYLYDIPNLARKIGKNYFVSISFSYNLSSIKFKKIVIADDVTELPDYTFYTESFCTPYLESITIPASVKKIGYQAFFRCEKLKEVIFEDGDEPIELSYNKDGGPALFGEGLFYDCPLEKVYIGRNLIYKNDSRYGFSPFRPRRRETNLTITVGDNVTNY